jgi:MoaA/NifB/PqqE/SkfB family radical SAM enzyme
MLKFLLPLKIVNLKAFRTFGFKPLQGLRGRGAEPHSPQSYPMPINFTVSVTNRCNARCKTCNIWRIYEEQPHLSKTELSAEEFEGIFENIGKAAYWFTISGGEPFLRKDIVDIYDALVHHCSPNIINIPTNATAPKLIEKRVGEFLEINNKSTLIINLSLDGVGSLHDEIRGVKGNFEKLINTYERLTALKADFVNLRVGVHTVVSIYNIDCIEDIYDFVRGLHPKPDSHIFEVAEERVELDTIGSEITPHHTSFSKAFTSLKEKIKDDYLKGDFLSRITQSFRLEYYEMVERILRERRQVIPCYACFASCQISPYGDVWACCVLAQSLGNLRATNFELYKLWHSEKAKEIRASIKRGECYCPLANAMYTSMFCNFSTMRRVLNRIF